MNTYKEFEQYYAQALKEYYGSGDYVPLLTEGYDKTIPKQVFDEVAEVLVDTVYELLGVKEVRTTKEKTTKLIKRNIAA